MSTVQEIEAAVPRLSPAELEQFRNWFEEYLEAHLELTDDVKAKLDQSRREIAAGCFHHHGTSDRRLTQPPLHQNTVKHN
jgi:hypothetical protein